MTRSRPHLQNALGSAVGGLFSEIVIEAPSDGERQSSGELHRRRIVVVLTLIAGAPLLFFSLTASPGNASFYPLAAGLALTWIVGGLLSGPVHLGRVESRRPVVAGLALGLAASAVFVLGALVVREIGPIDHLVQSVLRHASRGTLALVAVVTVANGVAEEVFFRGALYAALGGRRPVLISTVVYTVVTLATGNLMLTFAALTLGTVLALERRASGGVLGPSITHVTWSLVMLFALPPLFSVH
jgi:membrane protease YdiL (CAAX protease family)